MIEHFKLGFANRTLGYRLPEEPQGRRGAALQRLGVLRESGHEHLNGSLVVPIFGEAGRGARDVRAQGHADYKLRKGTPLHLYLPGPHRGVFNVAGARRPSKTVILCEALIDALTFWCAGFRNVTASYGVEGFTADHLEAFKRYGTERVLIAYDRDEAGERAAVALAEKLHGRGHRVLPGAVSEGDGRERVRAQGDAGREEPGRAASGTRPGSAEGARDERPTVRRRAVPARRTTALRTLLEPSECRRRAASHAEAAPSPTATPPSDRP